MSRGQSRRLRNVRATSADPPKAALSGHTGTSHSCQLREMVVVHTTRRSRSALMRLCQLKRFSDRPVQRMHDPGLGSIHERDRLAHDKHRSRVSTRNCIATQQRKGWCIRVRSSSTSITATGAAASEPRDIKLHPTAREIGVVPESVTAAAGVVGGSLRSFTP
jgi:hypothetical protein